MGGLVLALRARVAGAEGDPHRVRTFISFDAPHQGANIPLGIQYWVGFFAGQSADAAFLLGRLDTPAAREMLVYHSHALRRRPRRAPTRCARRASADLAAVGDWPQHLRRVAVANGSGRGVGQGFAAGAQIIRYDYNILLATSSATCGRCPTAAARQIFDGLIHIIFRPHADAR